MRAPNTMRLQRVSICLSILCFGCGAVSSWAQQQQPVTVQVEVAKRATDNSSKATTTLEDASNVVVWLSPLDRAAESSRCV